MKWGDKWGDKWGCPSFQEFRELCDQYQWKQLDHAPNWHKLCEILVETFAPVDDKIREMGERVGLDQAVGDEVDQWGAAVKQPRWGASDDLYKRAIKAAARKTFSQGRPHDFIDIAELINPEVGVTIQEVFPAAVRLFFRNLSADEQRILFGLMRHTEDTPGVAGLAIGTQLVEVDERGVFEWSYLNDDSSKLPVDYHWDHTDHDIPGDQIAGFAYLIE